MSLPLQPSPSSSERPSTKRSAGSADPRGTSAYKPIPSETFRAGITSFHAALLSDTIAHQPLSAPGDQKPRALKELHTRSAVLRAADLSAKLPLGCRTGAPPSYPGTFLATSDARHVPATTTLSCRHRAQGYRGRERSRGRYAAKPTPGSNKLNGKRKYTRYQVYTVGVLTIVCRGTRPRGSDTVASHVPHTLERAPYAHF